MRFLTSVNGDVDSSRPRGKAIEESPEFKQQTLATKLILQTFGSARTTRNDSSSRFGKYLQVRLLDGFSNEYETNRDASPILFDGKQQIVGARIWTYFLKRCRLVFQPEPEPSYHIFHQLCAGTPMKERRDYKLDSGITSSPINEFPLHRASSRAQAPPSTKMLKQKSMWSRRVRTSTTLTKYGNNRLLRGSLSRSDRCWRTGLGGTSSPQHCKIRQVVIKQGIIVSADGGVAETHSSAVGVSTSTTYPGKDVTVVKEGQKAGIHAGVDVGVAGSIYASTLTHSHRPKVSAAPRSPSTSGFRFAYIRPFTSSRKPSLHLVEASASASGSRKQLW